MTALIGALRVSLSADTANFEQGMRRAQSSANSAAGGIQKTLGALKAGVAGFVGALSVGMFVNVIKGALEYAGSLAEVAQQLGVTSQDLQTFRFAAGQVGVSQEQLETGLSKLTITLGKVAAGAKAPIAALNAIGISADQLKGKDTGEAFRIISDGLEKITDRSQRAAVEVALFGKSGAMLDNMLSGGSAALNELTAAAEKLGIVLSDEQIQQADDTADKLDALKTVLSASIAGVVADNANAILGLANALVSLVGMLGTALRAYQAFVAGVTVAQGYLKSLDPTNSASNRAAGRLDVAVGQAQLRDLANQQAGGSSAAARAAKFRAAIGAGPPVVSGGADIGKFLAGGGGGKRKGGGGREDHSAEKALRDSYQFDQELRRAQMDVLRAQRDLATDYVERTSIGVQILDAEKSAFEAELQYKVAIFKLSKGKEGLSEAQAAQLRAQNDIKDSLERQKLLQEEQEQRQKDVQELTQHDFDRRRDVLEAQEQIATTASERRKIELQLLDLAYEQKRQALQNIIDTSKDYAAQEDARRDLLNLNQTYAADRQGVMDQTRGPLEDWARSVPQTAAQINESLQSIEANGLDGLTDALTDVITGTRSLKDAFGDLAKSVIADLVKMSVKMLIFRALSGVFGSAFGGTSGFGSGVTPGGTSSFSLLDGFASGGSFSILGRGGTDRNILSLNGLPIARVSHGERVNIANDNGGGGIVIHQTFAPSFAGNAATMEDLQRMALITKTATMQAIQERGRRRAR